MALFFAVSLLALSGRCTPDIGLEWLSSCFKAKLEFWSPVPDERLQNTHVMMLESMTNSAISVYLIYESLRFIYLVYGLFWM